MAGIGAFPRSFLVVAPDPDRFAAACTASADALVINVAGAGDPDAARAGARACLALARPVPVWVKVHALAGDGLCDGDLAALTGGRPDGVFLPGATGPADVLRLSAVLAAREALAGLDDGTVGIIAVAADTPDGVLALGGYRDAGRRLAGLAFDGEALAAAMSIDAGAGGATGPVATARALLAVAAAAARVPAVDGPSPDVVDAISRDADAATARAMGYRAKLTRRTAEIAAINRGFAGG
ncbi:MAG TPA: aldolase/citrate lyase family protein [Bauldia sp.]|nr:aldolase/citrate lyase family protein [Bauldia sp.]